MAQISQTKHGGHQKVSKLIDFDKEHEIIIKNLYLSIGESCFPGKFLVGKEHGRIITGLLKYFTGNPGEYDLTKGIYLHGDFGLGKTTIFAIIRKLLSEISPIDETGKKQNANGFLITSIEQIIETYKEDGNMDYYGYRRDSKPINLCVNEFGKSINDKIYGTDADYLINSLMMIRYELFQKGILTHVTSNFHPSKLKTEKILSDRYVEMFNFIELKGESLRR